MAAVFTRLPLRVRCATQREHVFHPETSLIGSPSGGWPTISKRASPQKKTKNSLLLSYSRVRLFVHEAKRKVRIFSVSCRSAMNFVRESLFCGSHEKFGKCLA